MTEEQAPPPAAATPPVPPAPTSGQPWPAAPQQDAVMADASGQPVWAPVAAQPPSRRGRRIVIAVVAATASILVLGAAGVAAVVLLKPPTGEQAVRAYFERLAAGDAAGALAYVLPPERGSYSDHPLLSDAAIADPDARPTGLEVVERAQTTLRDGDIRERVTVRYTVDGIGFRQTILTRQQEPPRQPFLLEEPFLEFRVTGGDDGYSINDIEIAPDPRVPPLAFPGLYIGTAEQNALYAEVNARATGNLNAELPAVLRINFTPRLAAGAEEAVQAAVNDHLDGCLKDHAMAPITRDQSGEPVPCPFHVQADEVVSVNWSIARYPGIRLTPLGDDRQAVLVATDAAGLVRYDVPFPWLDGEFEFGYRGIAFVDGDTVQVGGNF